ncbi:MAG TPA: FKBP-type peptidyl-prolyl cis-trans isomerase [Desulfomonilaceae bacterium]|nr:FKBP-type peptidyl-prolyl cis-trans isomerase [Desulfomonilaceae bacterium]
MTEEVSTYAIEQRSCYVKIRYRVRIADGPVLKGGADPEVMDFVTGYGQVVPGLEKRLVGHAAGDKLAFTVPPDEAFGPRHPQLVIEKNKEDFHFPQGMQPMVGMELPIILGSEGPDTVMIREIKEKTIVVDANHPLSGASLQYELEIVEARPANADDVCAEWEEKGDGTSCSAEGACSSGLCQVVLGNNEQSEN